MAIQSADQIAVLAANAGFTGEDLAMAVAVALAESSGDPEVLGDNDKSVGLWQIYVPLHPEFEGWDLTDPQQNANAAHSVYVKAGHSFKPWTTFKNIALGKTPNASKHLTVAAQALADMTRPNEEPA